MLAASYHQAGLDVIDLATGAPTALDAESSVSATCFVPDSPYLVAVVDAEELTLWDVAARRIVARQRCQTAEWVAADPTGRFVAATMSGRVALFDARTLHRICQLAINGTAQSCDFDSTGTRLAVAGSAGLYLLRLVTGATSTR